MAQNDVSDLASHHSGDLRFIIAVRPKATAIEQPGHSLSESRCQAGNFIIVWTNRA